MSLHPSLRNEVAVIRPESISRRKLPLNLNPNDLGLFSHEFERVIPATRLLELHDVHVSPEGVLFQKGKMLAESFVYPETRASWKLRSVVKLFINNYVLRRRRRFDQDGVWVIDDWSAGYFHWLADVLPRLFAIREQLKDLVLLLPPEYNNLEFVRASLRPFVLGGVEFIGPNEAVRCKKLLVPMHTAPSGHYNEEIIKEVRNLLVGFYSTNEKTGSERVYISRGLALKRRIVNEDDVIGVLRDFDFRIVHPEDHSFAEQVRIASRARYLVSNHGAGLTNMLFMNSGTNVLELRHAGDSINNCYFTLASALNLNYFYQTCEPQSLHDDPHMASLIVDTNALRTNLKLMLGS